MAQNNWPLHEKVNQKKDILFDLLDFPSLSPGDQPLTKKPEDSGIEIEFPIASSRGYTRQLYNCKYDVCLEKVGFFPCHQIYVYLGEMYPDNFYGAVTDTIEKAPRKSRYR